MVDTPQEPLVDGRDDRGRFTDLVSYSTRSAFSQGTWGGPLAARGSACVTKRPHLLAEIIADLGLSRQAGIQAPGIEIEAGFLAQSLP